MRQRSLVFSIVLAAAALGCGPCPSDQLVANKELINRFAASINASDFDALDVMLTEDFRRHCQATPDVQVKSREEFRELQESFLVSVPDQHIALEMIVAEGDKVATYGTYSGTQSGPMGEFPATGKYFEIRFFSLFRIEDGRIAELWVEWDNLATLSQLGLYPSSAPLGD